MTTYLAKITSIESSNYNSLSPILSVMYVSSVEYNHYDHYKDMYMRDLKFNTH